MFNQVEIQSPK
uniref:Uncharacterized protein n=1 Tax=Rhizophora mucronata TaxID=61149 RepID=A0A2P2NBC7_RHIMU